jgi:hypothetical protein
MPKAWQSLDGQPELNFGAVWPAKMTQRGGVNQLTPRGKFPARNRMKSQYAGEELKLHENGLAAKYDLSADLYGEEFGETPHF